MIHSPEDSKNIMHTCGTCVICFIQIMKVLGIGWGVLYVNLVKCLRKEALKKQIICFTQIRHQQRCDPPTPPKNFFYQNGLKWPKMHFGSIFFFLENGFFQTHPPTKCGKFQIFFHPSLMLAGNSNIITKFLFY